ncbi:MAG: phage baseplate assembly protein V [Trueperaceae bacterium]|nr:phage baseplate assembly protein V [Trueperaceae bacterium]
MLRSGREQTQDARAEMERRDAGRLVIWATGPGDARIRPGQAVRLHGFGAALHEAQAVTDAEHTLDERAGYLTEFSTDPPRLQVPPEPMEVTVARVVDSDDPVGTGRVRVALEAFGDVTTGWLPVMIAGAGADKGLTIYPEADDVVLVLLCGTDPSAGIVLGGLYGTRPSADADIAGRRPRPYALRTPAASGCAWTTTASWCAWRTPTAATWR